MSQRRSHGSATRPEQRPRELIDLHPRRRLRRHLAADRHAATAASEGTAGSDEQAVAGRLRDHVRRALRHCHRRGGGRPRAGGRARRGSACVEARNRRRRAAGGDRRGRDRGRRRRRARARRRRKPRLTYAATPVSSERRNHLVLVALIVLALIGAALLAIPSSPIYKKPVLGLDLQGGLEVVLKAVPGREETLQKADLERSKEIIRNRIDRIGVSEPLVRTQGKDQIAVEMPGVKNADQARKVIGQTAKLELYDLQPALTGPSISTTAGFQPIPKNGLYDLLASATTQSLAKENGASSYTLFEQKGKKVVAGPLPTKEALLATAAAKKAGVNDGQLPEGVKIFALPNKTAVIRCGLRSDFCPGVGSVPGNRIYYYLFKYEPKGSAPVPEMTGGDLKLSGTRADFDPQSGQPIVLMQFTGDGAKKFHDITREEAQRGRRLYNASGGQGDPSLYNQNFAIVLDRELITAPSIDFDQYPDGISGSGGAQITGIGSTNEAKQIALVLQTGALPVDFVTLSETEISATLGEDSLREAAKAAAAGLLIVALFLLLVYRFLGLVAVIGLAIYAIFVYAAILVFNVTVTLPGFAGVILTIGVAADANIVIFERIKEESRAGKSVRAAVSAGYAKGFHTIVDANVVTAITALVLFVLATGGVKG